MSGPAELSILEPSSLNSTAVSAGAETVTSSAATLLSTTTSQESATQAGSEQTTQSRDERLASIRSTAVEIFNQSLKVKHHKTVSSTLGQKVVDLSDELAVQGPSLDPVVFDSYISRTISLCEECTTNLATIDSSTVFAHRKTRASTLKKLKLLIVECDKISAELRGDGTTQTTSTPSIGTHFSRASTALDGLGLLLETTTRLAESLPPLKSAAQTTLFLINSLKKYRENDQDCADLINKVVSILQRVESDFSRHTTHNEDLTKYCKRLNSLIQSVLDDLQDLSRATHVQRVVSGSKIASLLASANRRMDEAQQEYQTSLLSWIVGNIQATKSEYVPSTMLSRRPRPKPTIFHGRDQDVARAVEILLLPTAARIPIVGAGGIGKTSLALAIVHAPEVINRFGDRRLFLSCEAYSTAEATVTALAQLLQLSGRDPLPAVCDYLESSDSLLVLDNFESIWTGGSRSDAETFLQHISSLSRVYLILTMRGSQLPRGIIWSIPLQQAILSPIPAEAARTAFTEITQRDLSESELHAMDDLLRAVDYMPLAVVLLANLAADGEEPSSLLRQWETRHTALLSQDAAEGREYNVEVSIQLSLSRIPSTSEAIPLLAVCSYLPDGLHPDVILDMDTQFKLGIDHSIRIVKNLALVYTGEDKELRMLSPIRIYVRNHHAILPHHYDRLRDSAFGLAQLSNKSPKKSAHIIASRVLPQVGNITAILSTEISLLRGEPDQRLVDAVIAFSWFSSRTVPSAAMAEALRPHIKDIDSQMQLLLAIGYLHLMSDRMEKALEAAYELKDLAKSSSSKEHEASVLFLLGEVYRLINNLPEAKTMFEEASTLYSALSDVRSQASCKKSLGRIERTLGNYDQARAMIKDARDTFHVTGGQLGEATCIASLADVERYTSNYAEARNLFKEAQDKYMSVGHRLGQAQCLQSLGDVERILGNHQLALDLLTDAKTICKELGNVLGQADCLRSLGATYRDLENYVQARELLDAARVAYSSIGSRLGLAKCAR